MDDETSIQRTFEQREYYSKMGTEQDWDNKETVEISGKRTWRIWQPQNVKEKGIEWNND